ncbi:FAD-dependent oxidoreductase [Longimycelium tulufanense]|uniref:FAD-dependent oxidoreductase n=1 Tax=Longimycelium tulufanense TaxID=907463 RepID=A0A8J3CER5_9PSEU|nr:FAD-dependent monooxygenase [Longimycelium tulufanense]GGM68429.1 FAD-dependent oxidoreductase [Longimycelium tulufanense]
MTHAVIIGGGIAGPVTAMALHKAGINAVVYEAYPTGADDLGAFLALMNNGLDALRAIDAYHPVAAASFPTSYVETFNGTGQSLGVQAVGLLDDNRPRTITRAGLYRVLHNEATRRGIHIEHGKRLVTCEVTDRGVRARFADGTHADGDLLIGADGIHSTVRGVLNPAAPRPRYTGLDMVYGYTHDITHTTPADFFRMTYGTRAFFGYATAPDGHTWWFARIPGTPLSKDQLAAIGPAEWKSRTLPFFVDDTTPAADIIRATDTSVFGTSAYHIPHLPLWRQGPIILVGDAAHASSPAAGMGASLAIEDGVILALCLRDLPDTEQALQAYERLRRPRAERLIAASAQLGKRATPPSGAQHITPETRPSNPTWPCEHHIDWNTNLNHEPTTR